MENKKGVVEVQFNWVFIVIIGAVILIFFVSMSMKQKGVSEQKLSVTIAEHMKTILTSAEVTEKSVNLITVPGKDIKYDCGSGFSVSSMASFSPRIIFTPSLLKSQSQKLITWSLDWNVPFRVANFLYVTSPEVLYILVHDFSDVDHQCPTITLGQSACLVYSPSQSSAIPDAVRKKTGPAIGCWCGGKYVIESGYCCAGGNFVPDSGWRCWNVVTNAQLGANDCCDPIKNAFCPCRGVEVKNKAPTGWGLYEKEAEPPCAHGKPIDRTCWCGGGRKEGSSEQFRGFCCSDGAFIDTVNLAMRLNYELPDVVQVKFVTNINELKNKIIEFTKTNPYKIKIIFFNHVKSGKPVTNAVNFGDSGLSNVKNMPNEDVTAIDIETSENDIDSYGKIQFYKKSGNGFVKDGTPIPFLKKESLIGAVFADTPDIYQCNIKKAFDRLKMMGNLYSVRTNQLFNYYAINPNCQGYYADPKEFFNWVNTQLKYNDYDHIKIAYHTINGGSANQMYKPMRPIKSINQNLQLESCALIY